MKTPSASVRIPCLSLVLLASGSLAAPAAFTFTSPNPGFVPVTLGGIPLADIEGDVPGPRDLVGDAANPLLFVASDATHVYFRLRVDETPLATSTNFLPQSWGCVISTGSASAYQASTILDGINNPDLSSLFRNTVTTVTDSAVDSPDLPAIEALDTPLGTTVAHARVVSAGSNFGGTPDFFIDWAVDRSSLATAGLNLAAPLRLFCGAGSSGSVIDSDHAGSASVSPLSQAMSDPVNFSVSGASTCGDGVVGGAESCDDGNRNNGDGCNDVCLRERGQPCTSSTGCATGFCDPAGNVCACDADGDCPVGQSCDTVLNPNQCVPPGCGNGVLEPGEGCDDNNLNNGDGCSSSCLRELGQPCTQGSQCSSQFCDPAGNTCACDGNVDCPGGLSCNTLATPNTCVAPGCGNGALETGEGCDDGNTMNGDGCNSACRRELGQSCSTAAQCGSQFCDPAGNRCACDDAADCPAGQSCNTIANPNVCVAPGCGNGVLETGEGCDDGNVMNGDGCSSACLKELGQACSAAGQCASAFCDSGSNVCACDDAADCAAGQLCNTSAHACVAPGCGNGVPETGEGCDDGNVMNGDGCSSACLKELGQACSAAGQCASAFCASGSNVCACDDAADCVSGQLCNTSSHACVAPGCANGVLETGEGCDDGNGANGDGCSSSCLRELAVACTLANQCASGFCDPTGNVCTCSQDADCANARLCRTTSTPHACVAPGCGNGLLEATEACDDGNQSAGDGCSATCLLELGQLCTAAMQCASGACDSTNGRCACDGDDDCAAMQVCNTAAAPNACVAPGCGNATLEAGEACDDGNTTSGDGCSATCLLELGRTCSAAQQCASAFCDSSGACACNDDGDCPTSERCAATSQCVAPGCGNGLREAGEGCDDGSLSAGDGCTATCLRELTQACANAGECASGFCDAANSTCACDANADCPNLQQCNTGATPNVCVAPGCGNGLKESGEACDDGNTVPNDGCDAACRAEPGQACSTADDCTTQLCGADGVCATGKTLPGEGCGCTSLDVLAVQALGLVLLLRRKRRSSALTSRSPASC